MAASGSTSIGPATTEAALMRERYRGGTATLIDALDTERQRLQAQSGLARAQAMLTTDWIGLQSGLGLGWDPRGPSTVLPSCLTPMPSC